MVSLDKIDHIILKALLEDGRASFSAIARETKLTDVAIKKRVESLKRRGVIAGISVDMNYKALGYENPIFVQIRSEVSKHKDIIKKLNEMDFVLELYQILGEYNLIAKLIVPNLETAEKFINQLGLIDGVIDLKTMVVLSELKKSVTLPTKTLQNKI
ncbi:MAG: Lrp/AsnC family transcriptional regulator [Candidatus Diapherotrites archaeon]|uniref:Lrp/AsnC family transcriptional regulator n=1 Tax=Candidatus Iainarchaeum sp. TaxID=3101447 RepID=A0A8T5GFL6_9ARCH|nr:Lrp/AsnC family transcriptional regulator [Candidatus Diapherotrites archaeon]